MGVKGHRYTRVTIDGSPTEKPTSCNGSRWMAGRLVELGERWRGNKSPNTTRSTTEREAVKGELPDAGEGDSVSGKKGIPHLRGKLTPRIVCGPITANIYDDEVKWKLRDNLSNLNGPRKKPGDR